MASVYVRLHEPILPSFISTVRHDHNLYTDYDHNGVVVGVEVLEAIDVEIDGVSVMPRAD